MIKKIIIDKFIESSKDKFLYWDNILLKYENELSYIVDHEVKKDNILFEQTFSIFSEILTAFIELSNINDNWTEPFYEFQFTGMDAAIEVKNEDIKITIGVYENEFFLRTQLCNPKDLNKVSDDFWFNLLKLRKYGNFYFERDDSIESYNNIDIKTRYKSESHIFNLIKDYIFLDLADGRLLDIGILSITWPRATSWKELILKGCYGFELLYIINKEIISKDGINYYNF